MGLEAVNLVSPLLCTPADVNVPRLVPKLEAFRMLTLKVGFVPLPVAISISTSVSVAAVGPTVNDWRRSRSKFKLTFELLRLLLTSFLVVCA